jgi:RecA-family ATPase
MTKENKGFKMLTGKAFLEAEFEQVEAIVKYIAYSQNITIIAGQTGAGKSTVALQMALSIASGIQLFEYFETKQTKVMLIRFEGEDDDCQKVFRKMLPYFEEKTESMEWFNENILIKIMDKSDEDFVDNWVKIENALIENNFSDGVLIIDNMYTSTEVEIQKNDELKSLLRTLSNLKRQYRLTPILIAHPIKGVMQDKDLRVDQIQGGKILTNFVSSIVQMDMSTVSNDFRIMKITKAGRSEANQLHNIPFKLNIDYDNHIFIKGAVINNIEMHYENINQRWELKLIQELAKSKKLNIGTFSRTDLKSCIPEDYLSSHFSGNNIDTTITRFIDKLISWGLIIRKKRDSYELILDEIESLTP